MKKVFVFIIILAIILAIIIMLTYKPIDNRLDLSKMNQSEKINWFKTSSNEEKKEVLNPQQHHVIVQKKMEATYLGQNTYNEVEGEYYSIVCDYHMFSSKDKFNGQSGWLDFENINLSNAQFKEEYRSGTIEVYSICGEYLGYVEDNEILPSGKQFIINSVSLRFEKN